jgi:hypothetical protein
VDLLELGNDDHRALARLDRILLAVEEIRAVRQLPLDARRASEKFLGMLGGHAKHVALVLVPTARPFHRAGPRVLDVDALRLRQRGEHAL